MDPHSPTDAFRLPATSLAPRLARHRLRASWGDIAEFPRSVTELLVSELVTNAVQHPERQGQAQSEEVEVRLSRTSRLLRVEIWDGDPMALPELHKPSAPGEHGMGLLLVSELASRWGSDASTTGKAKVVWFELDLSPPLTGGEEND